jgi:Polysaccharide deacetylase
LYSKHLTWLGPLVLSLAACSSNSTGDDATGGAGGTGGSSGSAGKPGTGGTSTSAGGASTGGSQSTGGAHTGGTGGTGATGGSSGGTGGSLSGGTGGTGGTGGSGNAGASVGGSTTGGAGGSGGAGASAGSPGTGGSSGGAPAGGSPGSGGAHAGGSGGTGGSGGSGGGVVAMSGLPVPPGAANVPQPTGTGTTVTSVNWAGFKGAVTYSFDDDNDSQITNYNALQAVGGQYTFFMWTGKSEASNSIWATALKDGHEIGNHTMSHDPSGHCTLADINSATDFIQQHLSEKAWTMAAPNGDTCYKQYAQQVFFINRGVSPASPVMPGGNSDPLNLNCYIPAQGQQTSVFNSNVDAGRSAGGWVIYVVHGFTGDGNAYQPVDVSALTGAMNYTKSLGDMWMGSMVNVASYWLGQKAFMAAMTATSGTDKTYTWTLPQFFPTGKYLRVKTDGGTLKQNGNVLAWDAHGYYEIALDALSVTLSP